MAEPVKVASLGRAAAAALAGATSGSVLAVFRRSFYVDFRDASLVCVGPPSLGRGPLNLIAPFPAAQDWQQGMAVGAPVACRGAILSVGRICRLRLDQAELWRPTNLSATSPAALAQGLALLAAALKRRPVTRGLGPLLAELATAVPAPIHTAGDPLLDTAASSIAALSSWLAEALAGSNADAPALEGLVGLGPGLTPSGDDLIGGALGALGVFGRPDLMTRLARSVLPVAERETSRISLAHLRCGASGEPSEPLMQVLEQLARPDPALFDGTLERLDRVGHSSGWDALAGALIVAASLCAASGKLPRNRQSEFRSMGV